MTHRYPMSDSMQRACANPVRVFRERHKSMFMLNYWSILNTPGQGWRSQSDAARHCDSLRPSLGAQQPVIPSHRRLAFSALVLALTLASAELTARLLWSETDLVMNPVLWGFRDHPTLLWMYRRNADITCEGCPPIRTNSLGLRGPELAPTPAPGTVRILSLGESTTFGAFVAEEETYTAVLEDRLTARLAQHPVPGVTAVETINAGVEAWSIWQSRMWLEETGLGLQPDFVVIYHQLNDTLPTGVRDRTNFLYQVRDTDRAQLLRRRRLAPLYHVILRSRAYLALRYSLLRIPSDLPTLQHAPVEQFGHRVPDDDRRAALEDMHRLTTAAGAELVIIKPSYGAAPQLLRDQVLMEFAREHALPLVPMPRWVRREPAGGAYLYSDGVHPTAEGHRVYADAIAHVFAEQGLLERAAR